MRRISPRTRVLGVELVDLSGSESTSIFFHKVGAALQLILHYDARRLRIVQRDLRGIVLIAGGGEFYHQGLKAYVMDVPNLQVRTISQLALAIVHEATHARLDRAGIKYSTRLRARIERVCCAAELAMAGKLPDAKDLIDRIHRKLVTPWWTGDAMRERRLNQLRAHGVPQWLIRLYERCFPVDDTA